MNFGSMSICIFTLTRGHALKSIFSLVLPEFLSVFYVLFICTLAIAPAIFEFNEVNEVNNFKPFSCCKVTLWLYLNVRNSF